MIKPSIAVLGAGAWGTALALVLQRNQYPVHLWGRSASHMSNLRNQGENSRYLPGIPLPGELLLFDDVSLALAGVQDIVLAVPSHGFRGLLQTISALTLPPIRLLWACKGLDPDSHQLLHRVALEILGPSIPLAVLSGPSFATEVARALPTAVSIASGDPAWLGDLSKAFAQKYFRVYPTEDCIGVEVAGAVKNVMAIAAGIGDGMGLGANARCALVTRGLAEMTRLGVALGAQPATFQGLAGVGDLMLTCTDDQSRNRRLGLALGGGASLSVAQTQMGGVVEGVRNAEQVCRLAADRGVELPICNTLQKILAGQLSPEEGLEALLSR